MGSELIYDPKKIICTKSYNIGDEQRLYCCTFLKNERPKASEESERKTTSKILNENIVATLKYYDKYGTQEQLRDVEERCNIDLWREPNDQPVFNYPIYRSRKLYVRQDPDEDVDLNTIIRMQEFEKQVQETSIGITVERYMKYRSHVLIEQETYDQPVTTTDEDMCIVTIRTYHPYKHEVGKRNTKGVPKFDREFRVLGTTSLKEFRDAFACKQDLDSGEEKSECPTRSTAADVNDPGLFYINGIVYSDDRHSYEEGDKYLKQLKKWGDYKGFDIRIYGMNNIRFKDIYMKLGYPNVYQHRGCCEHLFIFSDVEFLTKEAAQKLDNKYPQITYTSNECKAYCSICSKYVATWLTVNNKRTVSDETLWCQTCFVRFNYTEHLEKIGEFKAYKYYY